MNPGLFKRRPRKISIDGEEYTVRALTIGEIRQVQKLGGDEKAIDVAPFIVSCAMLNGDGKPLFEGPSDPRIDDIPTDTLAEISSAIGKLSSAGNAASIEKN